MANDDDVIKRGNCSGSANWKLKAKPDDGRLEVEGEVDSNKHGQVWRWRIIHDGDVSATDAPPREGRADRSRSSAASSTPQAPTRSSGARSTSAAARSAEGG